MSLAMELKMTIARLMEEMTSDELVYWMAYSELVREEQETQKSKTETMQQVNVRRRR